MILPLFECLMNFEMCMHFRERDIPSISPPMRSAITKELNKKRELYDKRGGG